MIFSAEHVLVWYEQQWFISCGLLVYDKKTHFIRSLLCELRTPMICPHHHSHRAQAFSHEHGAMVPLAKYWKILGDEMVSSTITNNCLPPAISDAIKVLLWELKHLFLSTLEDTKLQVWYIYVPPPASLNHYYIITSIWAMLLMLWSFFSGVNVKPLHKPYS